MCTRISCLLLRGGTLITVFVYFIGQGIDDWVRLRSANQVCLLQPESSVRSWELQLYHDILSGVIFWLCLYYIVCTSRGPFIYNVKGVARNATTLSCVYFYSRICLFRASHRPIKHVITQVRCSHVTALNTTRSFIGIYI